MHEKYHIRVELYIDLQRIIVKIQGYSASFVSAIHGHPCPDPRQFQIPTVQNTKMFAAPPLFKDEGKKTMRNVDDYLPRSQLEKQYALKQIHANNPDSI